MAETGVPHAFDFLEPELQRIEAFRIDLQPFRVLEDQKRRSVPVDAPRHIFFDQDLAHAGADLLGGRLGLRADVLALDNREGGDGRSRAERVGVECSLMADLLAARAGRGFGIELVHDVGAPCDRSTRQPAGHDLGQDAHVRRDAESLLRSAARPAEAGDHLIEDHHHAVLLRCGAQLGEEILRQRHHAPRGA